MYEQVFSQMYIEYHSFSCHLHLFSLCQSTLKKDGLLLSTIIQAFYKHIFHSPGLKYV